MPVSVSGFPVASLLCWLNDVRAGLKFLAALVVMLFLCQTPPAFSQTPDTLEMNVIETKGDYTHVSGMIFAEKITDFTRVRMTRFGTGDMNVSARYWRSVAGVEMAAVVFVYPMPDETLLAAVAKEAGIPLVDDYAKLAMACTYEIFRASESFLQTMNGREILAPTSISTEFDGSRILGSQRIVEYDYSEPQANGGSSRIRSNFIVHCGIRNRWMLKVIFDYRPDYDFTAAMAAFNSALKWTFK